MASKYDRYSAKAVKGEFGESKLKHTPFACITFEVIEGDSEGRQFDWQGYLTDAAAERTVQSLRLAGCTFPGDDFTNLAGLGSKVVEIQVEQGDFGPRVAWVNEPRTGVSDDQKLDEKGKSALASKMKGLLISMRSGSAPAPAKKTTAADAASAFAAPPANEGGEPEQKATGTTDRIPF